ncbi:MAG: PKD domain-containing protein [Bacteroidales bacterium]|nr:PKD domain-containing protein [Bacteroidales bacterium]
MKKGVIFISLLVLLFNLKAQVGTTFWFAPPNVTDYHNPPNFPLYLLITTLDNPATVTISQPANPSFTPLIYNIPANTSQRVDLTSYRTLLETTPTNTIKNTGLLISATNKITVYYEVSNANNNEIYALKGENALGTEFYIPMHKDVNFYNHHFSNTPIDYAIASFDIIATEDNTTVLIYSPVPLDGIPANTLTSYTLHKGQTLSSGTTQTGNDPDGSGPITHYYQYPPYHPGGAIVISNKPIAITYKDDSDHDVPAGGCYDLIGDQIIPVDIAGTDYIAVKGGLANNGRESVILTGLYNNTKVYLNGNTNPIKTMVAGETYQIIIDSLNSSINNSIYIKTSKPVIATHITGFGCELGSAILPPLNCAGSSKIAFVRSSSETFILTFLVKTSATDAFTFTPSTASISPSDFKIVPGTNGEWSAARKTFTTTQIPVNTAFSVSNSESLFAMGLINGGSATGCRYGYFSEYVAKIFVDAGEDQTICANQTVQLAGSVTGGATQGKWTTSGNGTFSPSPYSLNAIYIPGPVDIANGSVTLTLTSVSECYPVSDNVTITILPAPQANAGADISVCKNKPSFQLNGSVSNATGGIWVGGSGTFSPNSTTLNATYTPTQQEIDNGSLTLYLITTGVGNCIPDTDDVQIIFTPAPTVNAGNDISVCANNAIVNLSGSFTVAGGVIWSGGSGSFNPGPTSPIVQYTPTQAEINAGSLTLTLTTTNNGNCNPVSDNVLITFTPAPTVDAGFDQTKCKNNATTQLNATFSGASGIIWSGGMGIFSPNNTSPTATYTPTAGELAAGFVQLTATTTGNGNCNAVSDNMIITFTDAPTANAGPDKTVCANNPTVQLEGSVSGATGGIWTGGSGTFSPNNTTLNATYTPSASEIAAGSVTLTLTTTGNGNCNAVSDQMVITITPAPVVNAGNDINVCKNNATVLLYGSVQNAGGGIWTGGSGTFSPSNTALNTYYYPTQAEISSGSLTLTLTSTNNGLCNAVSDEVLITFTEPPSVNAGPDQVKCANNPNTQISGTITGATGGIWSGGMGYYLPNNTSLNITYIPTQYEIANGVTLTLTSTGNGNCNPVSDNVSITFTPSPTADAGEDITVCANNPNAQLNGKVTIATGGIWSGGSGTFIPNNTTLNAIYIPSTSEILNGSVTLTLTTTGNGNCNPVSDQVKIYITPSPIVNAGSNLTACYNNPTVQLQGSVQNAGGGIWSGGTGNFQPNNSSLTALYTLSQQELNNGVATLILTSTGNGNCYAVKDTVQIFVTPSPIANAGPDQTLCANNSTVYLNGSVIGATGGQWSGGMGQYIPNNNSITTSYIPTMGEIASGQLTLTLTTTGNGNCLAVSDNVVINFTPSPTINAGPDQVVCANNPNVQLNATYTVSAGMIWTGGNGQFIPNNTTPNAIYIPTQAEIAAGQVTLTATTTGNGNCLAVSDNITIYINPAPIVNAGQDITSCANNPTVTLNGYILHASGGIWSGGNGTFYPSNTYLNAKYTPTPQEIQQGYVELTLTSTGNGTCNPVSDVVRINFLPAPIVNAGPDQIKCANNATTVLNGTVQNAGGGSWSNGIGLYSPNNNVLTATYTPSQTEINQGYTMLILTSTLNGPCNAVSDTMFIYYTPAPTVDAGSDITICRNNAIVNLSGSVTIASGGVWSAGGGTFSPSNTNLQTTYYPTPQELSQNSFTITLTSTGNGNCNPVSDNLTVHVISPPNVNAGPDKTICANNLQVGISGNISGITTTGIWTTSGNGTFSPSPTSLTATYYPGSLDSINGYVYLYLTSTNNQSCLPVTDTLKINILPIGTANAGNDITVCANNAVVNLSGNIGGGATSGFWTTTGTGVFWPNNSTLNAKYIPSTYDTATGVIYLILNAVSCNNAKDTLKLTITDAPYVNAGQDITVCANQKLIQLNGVVYGASNTGVWTTTGTGYFTPSNTALNAVYHISSQDSINQTVYLVLTSTNVGNCIPVSDTLKLRILQPGVVSAGPDQVLCANNNAVSLNGSITGGASQGMWQTSGDGHFVPNNTTLNATYIPGNNDINAGQVTLVLAATDACNFAYDVLQVNFTPAPTANAGNDITVCANNPNAQLNGSVTIATGGIWSGGNGTFIPNETTLNAVYIPSASEIANGNVKLILTTTGNGNCLPVTDTVNITIMPKPVVNAGPDLFVCYNNPSIQLNGTVQYAGGGTWSNGNGTFSPNQNALNAIYTLSQQELNTGSVYLVLTSTNNGTCLPVSDTVKITVTPAPTVNAGSDQTLCANNATVNLNGSVTVASGGQWSGGTGQFLPSPNLLSTSYIPTQQEIASGELSLILTTTGNGNCHAVSDTIKITFTPSPTANAGLDQTVCENNSAVNLSGSITIAGGGIWTSSGTGTFMPSNQSLNCTYLPSAADIQNGSVVLYLTTTNNGNCLPVTDTLKVTIVKKPNVNAGVDQYVCTAAQFSQLNGSISGITTTGIWQTLGDGIIIDPTNLQSLYYYGNNDTINGSVLIILTSTNNGPCLPVSDTLKMVFTNTTFVYAGEDINACITNTPFVTLNGFITGGSSTGVWSTNGNGYFTPSNTALNANYVFAPQDSLLQNIKMFLTSTNNGSCNAGFDTLQINIYKQPIISAGPDKYVCLETEQITINGFIQNVNNFYWTTTGTGYFYPNNQSINIIYYPSELDKILGSVSIILHTNDITPCNNLKDTMKIYFVKPVQPLFSNNVACLNKQVTFTNNTIVNYGTVTQWQWVIDDMYNIFSQNATFTFNTIGYHSVKLIATSSLGCSYSYEKLIYVNPLPTADFSNTLSCYRDTIYFTDNSFFNEGQINNWKWNFGDGTPIVYVKNPAHLFPSDNIYNVTLTVTTDSGCSSSITKTIDLLNLPVANFGYIDKCSNYTISFYDSTISPKPLTFYLWHFGDNTIDQGQNPIHQFLNAGNYNITLITGYSQNCTDTITKEVAVSKIVANFSYNMQCNSTTVQFIDISEAYNSTITQWLWDFGNGDTANIQNPEYNYPEAGTYNVTLIISDNKCSDTIEYQITHQFLTADFSYNFNCNNMTAYFQNNSTYVGAEPYEFLWTFGDDSTSTENNPTHQYSEIGDYLVTLITYSHFCSDTTSQLIKVSKLQSNFGYVYSCFDNSVNFYDSTLASNTQILSWKWNFGDNLYSSEQNTQHLYADTGTYLVTLTVTSDYCVDSITKTITIQKLKVNFDYTYNCENMEITTTNLTTFAGTTPEQYIWLFGDGSQSNEFEPTYQYTQTGDYLVSLISKTQFCSDTITKTIKVAKLVADFTYLLECNNNTIEFIDSSEALNTQILSWNWDFGDQTYSTGQNVLHTYADTGSYIITLSVISDICTDSISKQLKLQHLNTNFDYIYNCQNQKVNFSNTTTFAGIQPNQYTWLFGDGTTSFEINPSHVYNDTGKYSVTLIASTPGICIDSITKEISIINVTASFEVNNSCENETIHFTDNTNYPYGHIIYWNWNFGDGTSDNKPNTTHSYNSAGNYTVTLIIKTTENCTDTLSKIITIYPSPVANFTIQAENFEVGKPIYFIDASIGSKTWLWNFGDNTNTSNAQNPIHMYNFPGTFIVSQTVTNEFGCKDSVKQTIVINKGQEIYPPALPTAFSPNNDGINDTLFVRGGPFKQILFRVYNEWGQLLFETDNPLIGWDGKYKGIEQPIAVYLCTVEATTIDNRKYKFSQEVTLLK